ncbi:MAG: response regulator, partial [Gammaproteobacteria bacterium]|nr:response regulator [Gammaproteobacteria bacterium]
RLLDISRIESGNFPLVFETCNLHEEIENIVELHRKVVLAKGLSFDLVIQAEVPNRVTVDLYRLRHILQNLLNNAYKFTAQGGISVLLSANDLGGKVYAVNFSVKDTGIGISELDQKRLFDPFVQLENGTTRRYQGVGLGSTIAREMVRQMGGELHVLSTQGQGSTFHFTLNLRAAEFESPSKAASGAALPVSSAVTTKVLVVDDNEVNRMIAVKLLEKEGCEVDAVASGLAAISHARDRIYDLVFMDIDMPEMDGIETAKHLREGGNKSLPIIAMTAHTLAGDRERLLEAGMDDYVAKPFDRKIFANIVKKFKDNPHSTQYRSAK